MSRSDGPTRRSAAWRRAAVAGTLGVVLVAFSASTSVAQTSFLDDQPSVRNKQQYLEGRHTLAPLFGITLNDPYVQNLMGGLSYRYFLESWFGLGLNVAAGAGIETGLTDQINGELTALSGGQTFSLSTSALRLAADIAIELVPFEGKFSLLGAPVRMDIHVQVGFGIAMVSGTDRIEDDISIMPTFGFGMRFFPEKWLAVGVDIRDLIVNRTLSSRRDGSVPGASFGHNWMLALSVGFFLPTEPEVRP